MPRFGLLAAFGVLVAGTFAAPRDAAVTITFRQMTIQNDCDSVGAGEFYYSFKVDGAEILAVDRQKAAPINDGEKVALRGSRTETVRQEAGQAIEVTGTVSEVDEHAPVDHLAGEFTHRYAFDQGWNPGPKVVRLTGGGCDATVYYDVSVRE